MRKKLLLLFCLVVASNAFGQALPVFNNVSAPLLSTPGAYALAGGGASAANMGSFAPAAGAGAAVLVGAGALAVGTAVGYGLFGLVLGDGEGSAAVPLTDDPENGVPEPSAPATAGAPAITTCYAWTKVGYPVTPWVCGSTNMATASCEGAGGFVSGGQCYANGTNYNSVSTSSTSTCPAGYVVSGGVCVLSNARQVTPDNRNDVTRSGTGFAVPADDADIANPAVPKGVISTANNPNDTWQTVGSSSSGNPIVIKVQAQPGGGSQVDISEQVQDANANSFVRTRHLDIAPDATVISDSQTMGPASLTVDPATQTATQNNSTNTTPYNNPASQPEPITFPTDYARQGEAAAAATSITNALLATSAAPADPVLADAAQFDDAFFKNTFDGLKGWSVPNHVSTCPQPGFDWNGSSYTINSHCQLWTDHQSAIAAAMLVVWSIAALVVVLRA